MPRWLMAFELSLPMRCYIRRWWRSECDNTRDCGSSEEQQVTEKIVWREGRSLVRMWKRWKIQSYSGTESSHPVRQSALKLRVARRWFCTSLR